MRDEIVVAIGGPGFSLHEDVALQPEAHVFGLRGWNRKQRLICDPLVPGHGFGVSRDGDGIWDGCEDRYNLDIWQIQLQ